jgi:hypothetical protein
MGVYLLGVARITCPCDVANPTEPYAAPAESTKKPHINPAHESIERTVPRWGASVSTAALSRHTLKRSGHEPVLVVRGFGEP